jgi:dienelactone hydrolase
MCVPDLDDEPATVYRTQPHLHAFQTAAGAAAGDIVVESFTLEFQGFSYSSQIAYQAHAAPAPVILVFPNYAGLKQFDVDQAIFLAKLGYVGLAVDLYKYPIVERNPSKGCTKDERMMHFKKAFSEMNGLLKQPALFREFMGLYLAKARTHPAVHPSFAAAIGYCFGGQCCLELVRGGYDLQAIVSFHGVLQSRPGNFLQEPDFDPSVEAVGNNYNTKCKILIENGDLDGIVPQSSVDEFKLEMDAAGIDWRFNNHSQTKQ